MKLNSISRFVGMGSFLYVEALSAVWLRNFAVVSSVACDSNSSSNSDSTPVADELLDSNSSMKDNMVHANDEVTSSLLTCGATCCHCPSQAMTAQKSASSIRTVSMFLCVTRSVKGLAPALVIRSQCRDIAESNYWHHYVDEFLSFLCCGLCERNIPDDPRKSHPHSTSQACSGHEQLYTSRSTLFYLNSSQCCKNVQRFRRTDPQICARGAV